MATNENDQNRPDDEKNKPPVSPDEPGKQNAPGTETGSPDRNQEPQSKDDQDSNPDPDKDDAGDPKNKEAAKYRRQLREVETERDGLRTELDSLRTELLEARLPRGIKVKAVMAVATMDELMTDGRLDDKKIQGAITKARTELGLATGPRSELFSRATNKELAAPVTWADALKG